MSEERELEEREREKRACTRINEGKRTRKYTKLPFVPVARFVL